DVASPKALRDWIYTDNPILSLHITSFSDATCVGLGMSHTIADAGAARVIVYAWNQVLAGKAPPPLPERLFSSKDSKGAKEPVFDPDPCDIVAEGHDGKEAAVAPYLVRGWRLFLYFALFVLDLVLHRRETKRLIHLPKTFVQDLHKDVMRDLPTGTWVSSNDVISAWLVKTAFPHSRYPHGVTYVQLFNLRGKNVGIAPTAFGNRVLRTLAHIDTSLGSSMIQKNAVAIRRNIQIHTTKEEIQRQAAFKGARRNHNDTFYRVGESLFFNNSSVTSAIGAEMDWSGASYADSVAKNSSSLVSPRWIWVIVDLNGWPERNSSYMIRDREGAFWMQLNLREKDCVALERELAGQAMVIG
ncbi:MAG: hypothetical protein CYPHOPRED_003606, partial [Cyphobasidiales sp. Tagirdzhanova-0007]